MNYNEGLIRILNYEEHPTNSLYLVFHFTNENHANSFKAMLVENNVWFENDEDDNGEVVRYLFAIKKMDRKKALHCNYMVKAQYRNKFIPNKWLRWALILLTIFVLSLAIIGFLTH